MPKHKRTNMRILDKCLKGFWMKFSLVDPLGDHDKPVTVQVGHLNPVMNLRLTAGPFWEAMRQVLHHRRLKWRIEVRMEFKKGDKTEYKRSELVAVGRLPDVDEDYQQMVEDMLADAEQKNYLQHYVQTHVMQEVLKKSHQINDSDWSDD